MVHLGSPELPGEGEENVQTSDIHVTNYGHNSDDSDDEGIGTAYDGYEPLPLGETAEDISQNNERSRIPDDCPSSDLPPIESSDVEIARQVWSEPRPAVLNLELDSSRTQQIMSAMANITLPNSAIPDWAQTVPEERWKQDLLERIRGRGSSTSRSEEGPSN